MLEEVDKAMKAVYSEIKESLDQPGEKISYADFLDWCDENTFAEWVDEKNAN